MPNVCTKCGKRRPKHVKFCTSCGRPLVHKSTVEWTRAVFVNKIAEIAKGFAETIKGLGVLLLVGGCIATVVALFWSFFSPESWYQFRYSQEYNTDSSKVHVEPKPHDCDFDKAPFGNKECHFDKIVTVDKDANGKVSVYVGWQKVAE